jgi:hypothetical protein
MGHSGVSAQAPVPAQSISHEQASLHFTRFLHENAPAHVMSHGALPHRISSAQALRPLQWTSQLDASPHCTFFAHAWSPHTTRHGTLGGHMKSFAHEPVAVQSMTQTPPTHVPFGQPSSHSGRASEVASEVAIAESGVRPTHDEVSGAAHQPSFEQT